MIRVGNGSRWGAVVCLLACGCSTVREIPRGEYASVPERRHVRVDTQGGARYEFDQVRIAADSLRGQNRLETEGPFEEFQSVTLPLDQVVRLAVRRVDWYRTGLIFGVGAAVALAAILSQQGSGGGDVTPGPCGPRPCP